MLPYWSTFIFVPKFLHLVWFFCSNISSTSSIVNSPLSLRFLHLDSFVCDGNASVYSNRQIPVVAFLLLNMKVLLLVLVSFFLRQLILIVLGMFSKSNKSYMLLTLLPPNSSTINSVVILAKFCSRG